MKQSTIFMRGEADKWYRRNFNKSREPDRVLQAIKECNLRPKKVLEVGCGNGWRLKRIRDEIGSRCYGVDPSKDAITDCPNDNGILCWRGTANDLSERPEAAIDMVIYGFCLYLVDREDLFQVVAECDRVLRDNGTVVIHDFISDRPYANDYEHAEGVKSYKTDYGRLWLANPSYRSIYKKITGTETEQPKSRDDQVVVQILKKDMANAYPARTERLPWED